MKNSTWPTNLSSELAKQVGHRRWSRKQTLAVSAAALVVLYAGLLFALSDNAAAAGPALPTVQQTEPTPVPDQQSSSTQGEGVVSPTFLAEYDRLTNSDGEKAPEVIGGEIQNPTGLASTLTFSLLLIVALIYAGVWFYKRYMVTSGTIGPTTGGRLLDIQESQSIGPNQKLHLVRMGDELLLIGATDQNISFLARYDGELGSGSFANQLREATLPPEVGQKNSILDLSEGLQRLRGLGGSAFRSDSNG